MAIDRTAPDAVSGMTNKEVDAKVASAKAEGHTAGVVEGKAQADAAAKVATDAAVATTTANATKAANDRVKAIVGLEEAKGREGAALALATTTELTADQAKATLAVLPKAAAGEGNRSSDSPLGIALGSDKKQPGAADAYTPDELAAHMNKQFGAKK